MINQIIGTVKVVAKVKDTTVVGFSGPVQIYDGNWRSQDGLEFVLAPSADAAIMALLAAAIGRRLELVGQFQQDDESDGRVHAASVKTIVVD